MPRGLQALHPTPDLKRVTEPTSLFLESISPAVRRNRQPGQGAFAWALWSVILLYLLPSNLLFELGIDYDGAGGNPLSKIRPSTYVALGGAVVAVLNRVRARRSVMPPVPLSTAFMAITMLCAVFATVSIGATSISNYIDTFIAAGLLTYALEDSSPRQRRTLGYVMMGLTLLSAAVSLAEDYAQVHFIPVHLGDFDAKQIIGKGVDQFRGAGLYSGPLVGSVVTSMAAFLLIAMQPGLLTSGCMLALLIAGLLSFGGRAGLAITLLVLLLAGAALLAIRLIQRRLSARLLGASLAVLIVFPPIFGFLVSQTDLGARVFSHLYMDDSAEVRAYQWDVLDKLDLRDVLFGTPRKEVELMKSQIGLTGRGDDIESPWLLLFLNFGVIGLVPFMLGLAGFFLENARRGGSPAGWLLIGSYLAIASTSNSFGEKVSDFSYLVGFTYAMSGFDRRASISAFKRAIVQAPTQWQQQPALRLDATLGAMRGLRPSPSARPVRMMSATYHARQPRTSA